MDSKQIDVMVADASHEAPKCVARELPNALTNMSQQR